MVRVFLGVACLVLSLLLPRASRAAGGDVEFDDRPFNVQLRLGMGSSVGVMGVVGEFDLHDRLNLGAGLGTNVMGLIGGAHARLRPVIFRGSSGRAANALVVEAAVSHSRYSGGFDGLFSSMCEGDASDPRSNCYSPRVEEQWVWWGQIEFGWEFRHEKGMLVRTTIGGAWLLATPNWQCTVHGAPAPCGRHPPANGVGTTTLAVGYAF